MTPSSRPEFSIDPAVFYPALILLAVGVIAVVAMPGDGAATFAALQATIVKSASWFYVLVIAVIAVMVLVLAVSRYGDIKLGPDHAEPDYGFLSWFSMLFAAGVGVGLLFYGVAEPVMHFLSPPVGEGGDMAAAADGLQLTYLHWGFNAWATYAAVAMVLAYFSYRHDLPLTLALSLLSPHR
jgi:choline/glycine/proline betaine transport protein